MVNVTDIKSIGWLQASNNQIILTPVFGFNALPTKINISQEEFDQIKDDPVLMKAKACQIINGKY